MSTRSQCLTLESRKIDCALYNIFDQKLDPSVSYLDDKKGSTGMTLSVVQFTCIRSAEWQNKVDKVI
ncbi:hypothetical protein [Wolbachia endosymbiont of Drosophila subpulchrella]|uniref:hypothetical protein n=1 Tax=Wolbachia endosymbiont of Drosophila subpulchrella TaxID=2033655 RepID=UPI00142DE0BB|nr:hypothetical protein [Wolbachia endosymbiont of Drosophila subpulchrella]